MGPLCASVPSFKGLAACASHEILVGLAYDVACSVQQKSCASLQWVLCACRCWCCLHFLLSQMHMRSPRNPRLGVDLCPASFMPNVSVRHCKDQANDCTER